jgi:hypothetical protein
MGPSSSVGFFSIRHTHTRSQQQHKKKTTKHNQDTHKPVCTIRSLSGSFGQRCFCFIIQTESRFVFKSRTAVFSPSTRYTSRREQSRITRWPSFLFRSFRDTQRARSSFLQRDTHTHTITHALLHEARMGWMLRITRSRHRSRREGCQFFACYRCTRNSKSYRCFFLLFLI